MPKHSKRRPWTLEEDEIIRKLVNDYGTKRWTLISEKLSTVYK
jgi:hypothetical protein